MEIIFKKIKEDKYMTPISVLLAGVMIAGAIIYNGSVSKNDASPQDNSQKLLENVREVSINDHIRGDINAPIKIVEYSDTECPFCKQFHQNMKRIIDEYGPSGKVAWIYRHFPLDNLHSKARNEALALECAFEIGGNEKFWAYTDRIYEITPSNNKLEPSELPKIAAFVGLDVERFNNCLASNRYSQKIQKDLDNAIATGGKGTPWGIMIVGKEKIAISGAYPYETLKQMIEKNLQK